MHLTKTQNNIRIMLYTNHIPLNLFNYKFLIKTTNTTQYCSNEECNKKK